MVLNVARGWEYQLMASACKSRTVSRERVCVGVCAYNEEKNIHFLLKNLLTQQDLSDSHEIVVACSGCTDSTPQMVEGFQRQDPRVKLIVEKERRGKAKALNDIFKYASGAKGLILTNADALPEPLSIAKLVKAMDRPSVGAVAGRPVPLRRGSKLASMIVSLIWDLHDKISRYEAVKLSGELCIVRPSLVKRIPTNLATDEPYIEMMIRREGYEIAYLRDAIVYIRGPENISEIVKHRRRIWTGHLQIKRMEGFVVSTSDFSRILPMMVKSFRSNLKNLHILSLFVALELYSYLLARYDIHRNKIPFVWEMLKSTKTALSGNVREV
jgi:biofilm PGA synthesis N-glycosyltransferase PgaC